MNTLRTANATFLTALILIAPIAVGAQTLVEQPTLPGGTVNCFDYYRFGSVQANITAQTSSAVSGTPISFTGTLSNENPYPVIDGALYVKIFRLRDDPTEKNVNGPYVVDQFFVRDGIDLPANGSMPLIFSWDIPSMTPSGQYELATFFTTSKKYNLLGLSFTDDVVGNRASFRVSGEVPGTVRFDKDSVTVGEQPYRFAAFPPRETASEPVSIRARVVNESSGESTALVTWKVYAWDAARMENLIERVEESVRVGKGKDIVVEHTVTDTSYPVYLVEGMLSWRNTKSIINIRFVRQGMDRLRINFPAVTNFPLRGGEEVTLFSCLHNSGESPLVENGRLEMRLLDDNGVPIHEYAYEGGVTGAMMGVADTFVPRRGYNSFNLEAKLYQGNKLVDSAYIRYDCARIDPASCLPDSALASSGASRTFTIAAVAILVLLIAAGTTFVLRRRHSSLATASSIDIQQS